uniref:COP9 signalosome complex subunit 6a (Fragments) n=1 Tax=Brassica oleracea TaxID=3712 RepID=CSN6A_BRAOL|nr:RecName: Full=COP9 signalosome complex subunit 6a; Short=Signalosome subunit 6a [Brassica oleracea]
KGRTVEIFNSFELLLDPTTQTLDRSFLEKKQELYKKMLNSRIRVLHQYLAAKFNTAYERNTRRGGR